MIAFIGIPATSAGLFMLAGLLIGYLLWNRDRSADKRALKIAEQKLHAPQQPVEVRPVEPQPADVQQNADQRAEDRQTIRHCRAQIEQLSQIRDRLATANYELTRERDDHASELERVKSQLDSTVAQRQALEQQFEGVQRELGDVRNINEQLQAAIDEQTAEYEELTQRFAAKAYNEEKLEQKLKEAERDLQSLTLELESREERLAEQRRAIDASTQEKHQLLAQIDTLQPLAAQLPEREAELEQLRQSLEQLELEELQPLRKQLTWTTGELHAKQNTIRELTADLQQSTGALGELQTQAQQIAEERSVLQRSNEKLKGRLTELTSSVGEIKQQLTAAEEQNRQTVAAQAAASKAMERQMAQMVKLQQEAKRAELYREKVAIFDAKVRQLTTALRQVGGEPQTDASRMEGSSLPAHRLGEPSMTKRAA